MRPDDLFDRQAEWADLDGFVSSRARGLQIGVLYGRRRLGKSFLLRRLVRARGGLYHMALEEEPAPALQRFADLLAGSRGLGRGQLRFADWAEALSAALSGPEPLLVIDELPYLLAHSPGAEIPSVLQALVDDSRDRKDTTRKRVIVCGSALATMSELLSGGKALRGRAQLDLCLRPFDYRTTADYYGIADPHVAFHLYAIVGGIPGYRDLLAEASPQTHAELEELVIDTMCNPSHALFTEPAYLLREDPRISDRALYYSVLEAIANGASTPSKVAAVLGRPAGSLAHPLDVLTTAGFVRKDDDILLQRRPTLQVADPIVRFHDLVIAPRIGEFEDRKARPAFHDARQTLRTQVYGPAFESLARDWTARHANESTVGGAIGEVGATVVNDDLGKSRRQVDVVALAAGQRRQSRNPTLRAIGEAKDSDRTRTVADLTRLERVRGLLTARGADVASAKLLVFGRSGFDTDLINAARTRPDVELVDLDRIRHGS
jgi:AAA+ ATPase superfamily predicted ATPase